MTFLLFLGGFGGSKGFECVQNIKEYYSQYLQTYFLFFFSKKKVLSKKKLEKKFSQKYFSMHIFAIFFSAKCLIIISYCLP